MLGGFALRSIDGSHLFEPVLTPLLRSRFIRSESSVRPITGKSTHRRVSLAAALF